MRKSRSTGVMVLLLATLTLGIGFYFLFLRPVMLPEDIRFAGGVAGAIGPEMKRWLRIVFRTWGAFIVGFGVMLAGLGGTALSGRLSWLIWGAALGATVAFVQFVVSNVVLHSDFLWFVASMGLLAIGTSVKLVLWSRDHSPAHSPSTSDLA